MKVTNEPGEGRERENSLRVLPSSAIAIPAAITVSGAAIPAVATSVAKPKKKLIAGTMFASVAAAMSSCSGRRGQAADARAVPWLVRSRACSEQLSP